MPDPSTRAKSIVPGLASAPNGRPVEEGEPGPWARSRRPPCRVLSALGLVLAMSGCAELIEGPTIVPLTDRSFSIRYLPLRDGGATIERIAEIRCGHLGRVPSVVNSYRFTAFDVRETTFRCVADG